MLGTKKRHAKKAYPLSIPWLAERQSQTITQGNLTNRTIYKFGTQ